MRLYITQVSVPTTLLLSQVPPEGELCQVD